MTRSSILAEATQAGIMLHQLPTSYGRIAVWEARPSGGSTGCTLVLLHGMTYSCLSVFDLPVPNYRREEFSMLLTLAKTGFHVFGVDFNGYGFSDSHDRALSIDDDCRDVAQVCEWAKAYSDEPKLSLIGWSRGAQVASRACGLGYLRLDRLVLYAPFWGGTDGRAAALARRRHPVSLRRVNTIKHAAEDFLTPSNFDLTVRDTFCIRALDLDPTSPADRFADFAAGLPTHDPTKLHLPTLVVFGSNDVVSQPGDLVDFCAAHGSSEAELVEIANADHNIHFGHSRGAFYTAIKGFVLR